jgi:hypothetical protein
MKVVITMKIKRMLFLFVVLLLSACNPVQEDPEVDCTLTPNHIDCIEEVDCLVTPDHEDCIQEVDCTVTPDHEDCVQEVDCTVTPDHEDCVQEVDCTLTPDHEDCEIEPEECDDNQIEVDEECITLSGPEMQLYQSLLMMASQDNYQMDVSIQSPNDLTYTAVIAIDGTDSMYMDEGETIYYHQDGDICSETVVRWNQTTSNPIDCKTESSRFYTAFTYEMFELVSGQFYLEETFYPVVDDMVHTIDPDASLSSLSMQISPTGIDRLVVTIAWNEETYVMTYLFTGYGTTVIDRNQGGMTE